jgi:hypothetical protein
MTSKEVFKGLLNGEDGGDNSTFETPSSAPACPGAGTDSELEAADCKGLMGIGAGAGGSGGGGGGSIESWDVPVLLEPARLSPDAE